MISTGTTHGNKSIIDQRNEWHWNILYANMSVDTYYHILLKVLTLGAAQWP